jgi:Uncharacterized protein involved in cytokinesis, contains TGc (transglutaminase/protease-like) domain
MNKTKILAMALAIALMAGLMIPLSAFAKSGDAATVTASPTTQSLAAYRNATSDQWDWVTGMPIYAITQPGNANGNNYFKLRDLANLIDFAVEWRSETPNAMYIYTNKHYDGSQVSTAAATASKTATLSAMDIYINDTKVSANDLSIYMIDNNNYFQVRQLASLINFGCRYDKVKNCIMVSKYHTYDAGDVMGSVRNIVFDGEGGNTTNPTDPMVNHTRTFGAPSGTVSNSPVRVLPTSPMAAEDFFTKYASSSAKTALSNLNANPDEFNAWVQIVRDIPAVRAGVGKAGADGATHEAINPYYNTAYFIASDSTYMIGTAIGVAGYNSVTRNYLDPATGLSVLKKTEMVGTTSWVTQEDAKISNSASHILGQLSASMTTREKVAVLAKAVADKFEYDLNGNTGGTTTTMPDGSSEYIWNTTGTLRAECTGYQTAFRQLCQSADIPCIRMYSNNAGGSTGYHEWNEVYLAEEDKWVVVDVTLYDKGGQSAQYLMIDPVNYELWGNKTYSDNLIVVKEVLRLGYKLR